MIGIRRCSSRTALVSAAVLIFVAGCSMGDGDPPPTSSGPPMVIFDRSGTQQAAFEAPDGNINCEFLAGSGSDPTGTVRCDISDKTWQPPAKPASCQGDWGEGLGLADRATMLCITDTVRGQSSSAALPSGTAIRFAPFTCSNGPAGMNCVNTVTGSGFLIGQERYELRNP